MDLGGGGGGVRVVDSKSCRQLYLRTAYTFSRPDEEEEEDDGNMKKAKKCLGRVRNRVYRRDDHHNNNKGSMVMFRKVKEFSCASLLAMIRRMLACTAKVDAAHH